MDYNNNLQIPNQKESFLKNQNKNEDITAEIYSVSTMNSTKRLSRERFGMFLALIATFFLSLNCFYAKVILRAYPNDFDSIEFLFMRGLSIILYGTFQTFYSKQKVLNINELPLKFWFLIRANANFFYNAFSISALWYLRASTVQIIILLSPLLVLLLSNLFLKEPLYWRYLVGGIMCISGSIIIILNEKKSNNNNKTSEETENNNETNHLGVLLGVILSAISVFFYAIINISSKILASHRVSLNNQMIYIGGANVMYSFVYILIKRKICLKIGYIMMCILHGFFFYLYYICYNRALQLAQVNKIVVITYLQIVFVFILGNIFLGESIYNTDIIGTILMMSYMIYNVLNPIRIHTEKDKENINIVRMLSHFSMSEFSYFEEDNKNK
jgi:drug/metabolite transporter (DMT)-like permease